MAWECDRCGQIHTRNPTECRSCGHHVLAPVSDAELRSRSRGTDEPEPLEIDSRSPGTSPSEDLYSGPDTAPDGSLVGAESGSEESADGPASVDRLGWRLSSRLEVYAARPTAILVDAARVLVLLAVLAVLWFVAAPYL